MDVDAIRHQLPMNLPVMSIVSADGSVTVGFPIFSTSTGIVEGHFTRTDIANVVENFDKFHNNRLL